MSRNILDLDFHCTKYEFDAACVQFASAVIEVQLTSCQCNGGVASASGSGHA